MLTKKIAAITMARNDKFFLERWISYYGQNIGEENLYIFLDGTDQPFPDNSGKVNIVSIEHVVRSRADGDRYRISYLTNVAKELFKKYDLVIGTDADEFIVVDPILNLSLSEYLSSKKINTSLSALGIDIGQNLNEELPFDVSKPILDQRSYGVICSRYTKPSIISEPVRWGSGFHRIKGHNFHIDPNLYLFHLGYFDKGFLEKRMTDKDRLLGGWENHLMRRAEPIRLSTSKNPDEWDRVVPRARLLQTIARPLYALNKPAMLGWKPVIRIPERFKKVVI